MSGGPRHLSQGEIVSSRKSLGHTNVPRPEPHLLQGLCHQNGPLGALNPPKAGFWGAAAPSPSPPAPAASLGDSSANHFLQIICKSSALSQQWH